MKTLPCRDALVTRRDFLRRRGAGLLGTALGGTTLAAPAVAEYRRGGMTYRRLGQTDLHLSLLSFGSHTDPADRVRAGSDRTVLTQAGQARRNRMIERALDLGVNLLDVYDSEGQWEPAARLVKEKRDRVLISLMAGPFQRNPTDEAKAKGVISLAHGNMPEEIDRACEACGSTVIVPGEAHTLRVLRGGARVRPVPPGGGPTGSRLEARSTGVG